MTKIILEEEVKTVSHSVEKSTKLPGIRSLGPDREGILERMTFNLHLP